MPGTNLTRDEAAARSQVLAIDEYDVALELAGDGPTFPSTTVLRFSCTEPGVSSFVDLIAPAVREVTLNGRPLDVADVVADNRIRLDGLADANELRVVADCAYMRTGEGLHRFVDPADSRTYLYTQFEVPDARRVFASFEQPDLKATFTLHVTAPASWEVVSNSPTPEPTPVGGTGAAGDALARWDFAPTERISTYLVAVVAGPYAKVTDSWTGTYGTVPMALYCRPSIAEHLDAEDLFTVTKQGFAFYEEQFACAYPFGKYDQLFVPEFNAGAMENAGAVTIRDEYVFRSRQTASAYEGRANTVLHELAHMWFGDLVTMRWWDDLWLNESFAEYLAYRVCSEVTDYPAWTEFGIQRKSWGHVADQSPSTHPVAGNGSDDAASALADFDGISYAKGASVLKQLAAHVGDDVFLGGLRSYFQRHSFDNAELADLIRAWTDAGAVDLDNWAVQWLRTTGLDTLSAEVSDSAVTVTRTPPDDSHRPHTVRVAAYDGAGALITERPVALDGIPVSMPVSGPVRLAVPDSADDTWAKIRFGGGDWAPVAELLPRIANPLTRVVLHNSIRDGVRDADLDPAAALDMLLDAVPAETVQPVATAALQFATEQLAGPYAPPAERAPRRARIAGVARGLLAGAAAGSDAQLGAARAWIRACDAGEPLRHWLDGQDVPAGLVIDAELRWSLVIRLAALGELSGADIDAELDRDKCTSGVLHATRARAGLPTAGAKAVAWRMLVEPSDVPAYELYATAAGFFDARRPGPHRPLCGAVLRRDAGHRAAPARLGAGARRPGGLSFRRRLAGRTDARGRSHRTPRPGPGRAPVVRGRGRPAAPGDRFTEPLWQGAQALSDRTLGSPHD